MKSHCSLVLGGAGFIGSHLVRRLVAAGDDVHVLVRDTTSLDRIADLEVTVHSVDLGNASAVLRCFTSAKPDRVFHLAAETRAYSTRAISAARTALSYVAELFNVLEAMASIDVPPTVIVRGGTIAEYGEGPVPYRETQREKPLTAYATSMTAGTRHLDMLDDKLPFRTITARLALVYGPSQSESFLISSLIRSCLQGSKTLIRHPNDRRDLIYVDDAVDALILLAESPPEGCNLLNVCTGIAPTMREVANEIVAATGADPTLVEFGDFASDLGISELRSSPELAARCLGWNATTKLEDGIARTVVATRKALGMRDRVLT